MDLRALLNRIGNPLTIWLLRSPLHRLLSGSLMLVTVTGRRTGAEYTLPVNYRRDGQTLAVVSQRSRTWWRNLGTGAPVVVRLAGHDRPAWGEVIDDEPGVAVDTPVDHDRVRLHFRLAEAGEVPAPVGRSTAPAP